MLHDRLVCGVMHERIQQRLLSEDEGLTLDKATNIALSMESAIAQANEIQTHHHQQQSNGDNTLNQVTSKPGKPFKRNDCFHCGGNHAPGSCQFKDTECFYCRNKWHTTRVCRKKNRVTQFNTKVNQLSNTSMEQGDYQHLSTNTMNLYHLGLPREAPIRIQVTINNHPVEMEVDTGTSVTVMSADLFHAKFDIPITPINEWLRTYSG